jgi:hypothetical protein
MGVCWSSFRGLLALRNRGFCDNTRGSGSSIFFLFHCFIRKYPDNSSFLVSSNQYRSLFTSEWAPRAYRQSSHSVLGPLSHVPSRRTTSPSKLCPRPNHSFFPLTLGCHRLLSSLGRPLARGLYLDVLIV